MFLNHKKSGGNTALVKFCEEPKELDLRLKYKDYMRKVSLLNTYRNLYEETL